MKKKAAPETSDVLPVADLEKQAQSWILDGEIRQLSDRTLDTRKDLVRKLIWFLKQRGFETCGMQEAQAFLAYVDKGDDGGGRWGNPNGKKRVTPRTVLSYYVNLKTLFRYLVAEGTLSESPVDRIKSPVVRRDQVKPFTNEQLKALLQAAKNTRRPKRDTALALFMADTGCRASEVCGVTVGDLDPSGRRCLVLGKGNKTRTVVFGAETARALIRYLNEEKRERDDYLFLSERGSEMSRSGLLQFCQRLGSAAKVDDCHPHRFRHTFCVMFLRNGGSAFTLQTLLGHTTLTMTQRYVALAQADLDTAGKQFSPVDRLRAPK